MKKGAKKWLNRATIILTPLLVLPTTSHAGFFSFMSNEVNASAYASFDSSEANSQNLALLEAVLSVNPNPIRTMSKPLLSQELPSILKQAHQELWLTSPTAYQLLKSAHILFAKEIHCLKLHPCLRCRSILFSGQMTD